MYCSACGEQLPDDTRFCRSCGASVGLPVVPPFGTPVAPPTEPAASAGAPTAHATEVRMAATQVMATQLMASPPAVPPPPAGFPAGYGGGAGGYPPSGTGQPGGRKRWGMWIAIAAAAVVVIAVAITVPLVLARGGDGQVTETTTVTSTSTTSVAEVTSTTENTPSSSSTSTSTTVAAGPPGDSAGEWVEMTIPGAPSQVVAVAVCNDGLVMETQAGSSMKLYAHSFISGNTVELPVGTGDIGGIDVDKNTAVWWEGTYDDASGSYTDQHIYSYAFPEGPKIEVAGGDKNVGYPQIADIWVTWVEGTPWDVNPEEYWRMPIFGAFVSLGSGSANEPQELVPSAIASIMGDASWSYSLDKTYLAWEQAAAVGGLDTGSYILDLMNPTSEPMSLGTSAWRPSVSGDNVVYWEDGLKLLNLASSDKQDVDAQGDFPTAAPTFIAYFRPVEGGDSTRYDIVARGLTGGHEQVLAQQNDPPWLSQAISACGQHVAFVANETLHVFEWKGN
jgi:hypothetical protein